MDQAAFYEAKLNFEIDSADLHDAVANGENITIVDARSAETLAEEHIPGAINIPHQTMDTDSTAQIDKASLVVTYCDGIGCNASTKGALNMVRLGFRVKELQGGILWWKQDGYATE
tara:strand:- start:251 stop:598 length:348 start_codon:yes stop_codon:yes gene_type:complete